MLAELALTVQRNALDTLCLLTGSGFKISSRSANTIEELLCRELEIESSYLWNRIQTIFMNSKTVDDPSTTPVELGSTIALSAAMPGVAGAMLRKESRYAAMRSAISHHDSPGMPSPELGNEKIIVTIQLFNRLQHELGPGFLKRGIRVSGNEFSDLLNRRHDFLQSAILSVVLDGQPAPVPALFAMDWTNRDIQLTVEVS